MGVGVGEGEGEGEGGNFCCFFVNIHRSVKDNRVPQNKTKKEIVRSTK